MATLDAVCWWVEEEAAAEGTEELAVASRVCLFGCW